MISNNMPSKRKIKFCQHLRAKQALYGNPQRLYVLYDSKGDIIDVVDEGYYGEPKRCKTAMKLMEINISTSDYHSIKEEYGT